MAHQGDPLLEDLCWEEAWDPYHGVVGAHLLAACKDLKKKNSP